MPQISLITEMHSDQLGTPRKATDIYGITDWSAEYEPFGTTSNVVVQGYTGPVTQNLRLPGQYADAESGFSQNGFRDYVPGWGRYLQSDPIGLGGGMNIYGYVGGNPLNRIDPRGLDWVYHQSTGQTTHDTNGNSTNAGTGYAGTGEGRNNPDMQNVPNTGPIPQGSYDIRDGHNSPNTGPNTMNLTPQDGTDTFGRDAFRIHGDNAEHDASHGCVILGPDVRRQINNSDDKTLKVVP